MTQNLKLSSNNFKQLSVHHTEAVRRETKNQGTSQQLSDRQDLKNSSQRTNGGTKYYNGQLFQRQIEMKKDLKVQVSAHTTSQYLQENSVDQQKQNEIIQVLPKIQYCDEKLQLSIDLQCGNQIQTINFDIDITNQNLEKQSNLISSGEICPCCNHQQSQLTRQKLLEFEDSYWIQDSVLRAKLRKGSCNSDLSDATLINEPVCYKQQFDQAGNASFKYRQEEEGLKNQKFQNFDNCKSELSEQKSSLEINNKQQLLINQTSNIFLNNNNYITSLFDNQESTNQSQITNKENPPLYQSTQNVVYINPILKNNLKSDKSIINEPHSNIKPIQQDNQSQKNLILSPSIQSILQNQIDYEFLQRAEIPQMQSQLQNQFVMKTPSKSEEMADNKKSTSSFQENIQSDQDFNDSYNAVNDIEFTKEYLAKAEKKNVVKNFVKAFKSFLYEQENKENIIKILEMKEIRDLEQFRQRFSGYLKKKKYNNKLIKDLLISQSYSIIFENWLLNYAQDWLLNHSKVENKDSHLIMLQYFQKCIDQPDQLDKLKVLKNPRKQSFCTSSTALLSTPLESNLPNKSSSINFQQLSNGIEEDQTPLKQKNFISEFNILQIFCEQESSLKQFEQ